MKNIANKSQTLLNLLKELCPDSSIRTIKNWILNCRIKVNEKHVTKPHQIVEKGSELRLTAFKKELYPNLDVIFESSDYLVLSKPANLLTVPLEHGFEKNVFNILKKNYPNKQILPINRLDREVSGLVLFAKNKQTQLAFKKLFEMRQVDKFYIALVENNFSEEKGVFESPLTELKSLNVVTDPNGKEAKTYFKVINSNKNYTTLLLNPKTGRKHQLRVHCANAFHPILGDSRYGSKKTFHKRLALHALYLRFTDPITNEKKEIFSDAPLEFCLKNQKKLYASVKECLE